jgi:Tfp pilus assembly protein PilV
MTPETKPKLIGLIAVGLLVAAGTGTVIWMNRDEAATRDSASTDTSSSVASSPITPTDSAATYKNGTYSADGTYRSPGGNEKIGVTLTIADGTISEVSVTPYATDGDAQQYQDLFKAGISDVVVGKKVNEVSVSRVSGSSLTSTGFNNALEAIKSEAKA